MVLYHATYASRIASIKKGGLDGHHNKNWTFSEVGTVCFALDADEAISYCEVAEDAAEVDYNSGIVVLVVDSENLPLAIGYDRNNRDETTYSYFGSINPSLIGVLSEDQLKITRLVEERS